MKYSLFIGRFQPLHEGHIKLIQTVLSEGKKICIGLRDTEINEDNPYTIEEREKMFRKEFGDIKIITLPDIEAVCFGRGVGYDIREIKLDKQTEKISATEMRKK